MHRTRLLVCCFLVVWAGSAFGLFNPLSVLETRTKTERRLSQMAAEIVDLGRSAKGGARLDSEARRLFDQGMRVWARSPANSDKAVMSVRNRSGYEAAVLVRAMADYYALTGRSGLAIPILIKGIDESKALRYYSEWRELTLELVRSYRRLGMVDHADARLTELLQFMERFGFTLEHMPTEMNMDAVVFARLHAMRIEIKPEFYRNADQVMALFRFYLKTVESTPQAWGWEARVGFRYTPHAASFLYWFASHGDPQSLAYVRDGYARIHARNLSINPYVLSDELGTNFADSQLGFDIYSSGGWRGMAGLESLRGDVRTLPVAQRRYVALAAFTQALDSARASRLAGEFGAALDQVRQARREVPAVEAFYGELALEYRLLDRFPLELMRLTKVEAQVLEGLGRWNDALGKYEEYIRWSESERASLPLEERQHFFRGQGRQAYLGAIRALAELYREHPLDESLTRLLVGIERLKACQFQEALGVEQGDVQLTLARLREKLGPDEGILLIQDAESEVLTILLSRDRSLLSCTTKTPDWDDWVFELRNRLAEDVEYDEQEFTELGTRVIGETADGIDSLRHLLVVTDGSLSALPPSILPYRQGRLLGDARYLTLIPSLDLWLARGDVPAPPEKAHSLFVVADPVFEEKKREKKIGRKLMATRGSASLKYFQRLPETLEEAHSILNSFPKGSKLLAGEDAVESVVKREPLDGYTNLHFATHGIIGNDLPGFTEPALVLGNEEGEDGFLFASEVADLELNADLTVLSACNTGNGQYFNGEGLMGMGRAFMIAGSKSVIVSLWPVESRSTERLMEYLYRFMGEGMSPDLALWNAQRELRGQGGERGVRVETTAAASKPAPEGDEQPTVPVEEAGFGSQYDNPYYWSPFLLISSG